MYGRLPRSGRLMPISGGGALVRNKRDRSDVTSDSMVALHRTRIGLEHSRFGFDTAGLQAVVLLSERNGSYTHTHTIFAAKSATWCVAAPDPDSTFVCTSRTVSQ